MLGADAAVAALTQGNGSLPHFSSSPNRRGFFEGLEVCYLVSTDGQGADRLSKRSKVRQGTANATQDSPRDSLQAEIPWTLKFTGPQPVKGVTGLMHRSISCKQAREAGFALTGATSHT